MNRLTLTPVALNAAQDTRARKQASTLTRLSVDVGFLNLNSLLSLNAHKKSDLFEPGGGQAEIAERMNPWTSAAAFPNVCLSRIDRGGPARGALPSNPGEGPCNRSAAFYRSIRRAGVSREIATWLADQALHEGLLTLFPLNRESRHIA